METKKKLRVTKGKDITEEQARQMDAWYEEYNTLLRGMFHDVTWVELFGQSKRLRILSLCLYYQFITAQQVLMLQLTPGGMLETENTFLYRLTTKQKYLKRQKVTTTQSDTIIAYTLSTAGVTFCISKLKELMVTARAKNLPYAITDECIEAIKERFFKLRERKNNGHFLGTLDINAFLLSPSVPSPYTFHLETGIETNGRIVPFYERLLYNIERDNGYFQCDALYQSVYEKNMPCNVYIELDTGTQREKPLSSKIDNYASTVFPLGKSEGSRTHFLLFAIQTHTAHLSKRNINKKINNAESLSSVGLNYLRTAVLCAKNQLYAKGETMESLPDYPLQSIVNFLEDTDSQNMPAAISNDFNEFYRSANVYYRSVLRDIPDATIEDLVDTVHMHTNTRKEILHEFQETKHKEAYQNRRAILFSAADSSKHGTATLLRGFSIFTIPSREPGKVTPFLAPGLLGSDISDHLGYLLSFLGYLPDSKVKYVYEPVTNTLPSLGYVLRNHYTYKIPREDLHVYVENVSDDIGGYTRMVHYLKGISWRQEQGILLCLTSEDNIEKLKKVWKDSLYAQSIYSDMHISIPLEVIFITYEQFTQNRGAFVFDDYMNIQTLQMGERALNNNNCNN